VYSIDVETGLFLMQINATLDHTMYVDPSSSSPSTVDADTVGFSLGTFITWTGSAPESQCNYPSTDSSRESFWKKVPAAVGQCKDTWVLNAAWALARASCGFSLNSATGVWSNEVRVERGYSIPFNTTFKRSSLTRTESVSFIVAITFPTEVTIDTGVTVSGARAALVQKALSDTEYIASLNLWRVDITTYTKAPYHLVLQSSDASSGFSGRNPYSNSSNIDRCDSNTANCYQLFTTYIQGCELLNGDLDIPVNIACNDASGSGCTSTTDHVVLTVTLSTRSACNATTSVDVQQKTLTSYDASTLSSASITSSFNLMDTAYFSAFINSSDATITERTLNSLCFVLNPTTSSTCTAVTWTTIASSDPKKDPAFSVDLEQLSSLTSYSTAQSFEVRATVGLKWEGQSKRSTEARIGADSTEVIQNIRVFDGKDVADVENKDTQATTSSDSNVWKMATIALVSIFGGVCVAALIAIAVLLRRKNNIKSTQA